MPLLSAEFLESKGVSLADDGADTPPEPEVDDAADEVVEGEPEPEEPAGDEVTEGEGEPEKAPEAKAEEPAEEEPAFSLEALRQNFRPDLSAIEAKLGPADPEDPDPYREILVEQETKRQFLASAQALQAVNREVAEARQKYPDVPREWIVDAVAANPSRSAVQIAKAMNDKIEAQVKARLAKAQPEKKAAPKQQAPPRPSKHGGASRTAGDESASKPQNLDEVLKRLRMAPAN